MQVTNLKFQIRQFCSLWVKDTRLQVAHAKERETFAIVTAQIVEEKLWENWERREKLPGCWLEKEYHFCLQLL